MPLYIPAQGDLIKIVHNMDDNSVYEDHRHLIVLSSKQYNCTAGLMICSPVQDSCHMSKENSDTRIEARRKTISVRWINWRAVSLVIIGRISKEHLREVLDNTMQSFIAQ